MSRPRASVILLLLGSTACARSAAPEPEGHAADHEPAPATPDDRRESVELLRPSVVADEQPDPPIVADPVVPDPATSITGRVVDEHGKGVPDLEVSIELIRPIVVGDEHEEREPRASGRTDASGRFAFSGLEPRTWRVRVSEGELGDQSTTRDGVRPGAAPLRIEVLLGGRIEGTVVWPDGSAAKNLSAWIDGEWRAVGGLDGRFVLHSLLRRRCDVVVQAIGHGFEGSARALDVPVDGPPLHLVLTKTSFFDLAGRVEDEAGAPIGGGTVLSSFFDSDHDLSTATRADGSFELARLRPGPWTFSIWVDGFLPFRSELEIGSRDAGERAPDPLRVVLRRAARVRGQVVDESGRPLAGATVSVGESSAAVSDDDGRFEAFAYADTVVVRAEKLTFVSSDPIRLTPEPGALVDDLVLRLRSGWRLTGQLIDDVGQPVVGLHVDASAPGWGAFAETDELGEFVLHGTFEGLVDLRAIDRRLGRRVRAALVLASGATPTVALRFAPMAPLHLRGVVTLAGKPVVRALAFVHPDFLARTSSDAEGRFEVTLQCPGAWRGYALDDPLETRRFELRAPDTADVVFDLALETLPLTESPAELEEW